MEAILTNLLAGGSLLGVIAVVGWWLAKQAINVFTAAGEAYAKRKGENLATKEDFDQLLHQLRKNTEATEQIRTEIAHQDWAAREWKAARSRKLEELLLLVGAVDRWHDELWELTIAGNFGRPPKDDPSDHALALQVMYFPELRDVVREFLGLMAAARSDLFGLQGQNAGLDADIKINNVKASMPQLGNRFDKARAAKLAIREAVGDVMVATFGEQARLPEPDRQT